MSELIQFKQTMDCIQAKYTSITKCNCTKSGSHDDFHFIPENEAFVSVLLADVHEHLKQALVKLTAFLDPKLLDSGVFHDSNKPSHRGKQQQEKQDKE